MGDAKASGPRRPDPELLKLLGFWGQRRNSDRFQAFFTQHAHLFDAECRSAEQRLEYTAVFEAYCALYDEVLGDFLEANGLQTTDFADRARRALESEGASIDKQILRAILSATDYRAFVRMMSDTKAAMADSKGGGDGRPETPPTAPCTPRAEGKEASVVREAKEEDGAK